jgi:hypothetical protein
LTFNDHQYYNCEITLSDNTKYRVDANWIHNQNLDHWQDWECDAGFNRIVIEADLSVYSGECFNDYLGNLKTKWTLLDQPTICQKSRCTGCTDDLLQRKKEIQ